MKKLVPILSIIRSFRRRRISLWLIFFAFCVTAHAQTPANLWQDTIYTAQGQYNGERYGQQGLSFLGQTDSSLTTVAIGVGGGSHWILNRFRLDTGTVYISAGEKIIKCNLSGTGRGDYVLYDQSQQTVMVLYATNTPFVFDTVYHHHGSGQQFLGLRNGIIVANIDSSQYESLLLFDNQGHVANVYWFRGGTVFDTTPTIIPNFPLTGQWAVGNIQDAQRQFICGTNWINNDTMYINLIPFSKSLSASSFVFTDSIFCNTSGSGGFEGGFLLLDADGDSIQDIFLGYDGGALIYKGGKVISSKPAYVLHAPTNVTTVTFGAQIVSVGHTVNQGYQSVLITDPQAVDGESGGVFLYNLGKGYTGQCTALATGEIFDRFGTQAVGIGHWTGQQLDNFMVSASGDIEFSGQIYVFGGNNAYGPMVSVHEGINIPTLFNLSQNYPNPVAGQTTITFSVLSEELFGGELTLKLYDALGREVETLFHGKADGFGYTIEANTEELSEGTYFYRLECGGKTAIKMMSVIK